MKLEDAIKLADKYFEAFPNFNFPYNYQTAYILDVYIKAGAIDKAKPHLEILANNILDELEFYQSLSPRILQSSYGQASSLANNSMTGILTLAQQMNDPDLLQRLQAMFSPYIQVPANAPEQFRD